MKTTKISISIDLHGTPFQQLVWGVLNKILYGKTYSYTDKANHIKKLMPFAPLEKIQYWSQFLVTV
ncbi:MGMT family protein [Bacillus fungorum]